MVVVLCMWEALTRSFHASTRDLMKVLTNLALFIAPIVYTTYHSRDYQTMASILLFAFAGAVIGPDMHRYLVGVRRVDWFHYAIGMHVGVPTLLYVVPLSFMYHIIIGYS